MQNILAQVTVPLWTYLPWCGDTMTPDSQRAFNQSAIQCSSEVQAALSDHELFSSSLHACNHASGVHACSGAAHFAAYRSPLLESWTRSAAVHALHCSCVQTLCVSEE